MEEREKLMVANTHIEHWNNSKDHSSPLSPVSVAFVRNDIGCGGWRRGGALLDPPTNKNKPAKPQTVSETPRCITKPTLLRNVHN